MNIFNKTGKAIQHHDSHLHRHHLRQRHQQHDQQALPLATTAASPTDTPANSLLNIAAVAAATDDEDDDVNHDLTLSTVTHLSLADLNEINQSTELQCLIQEHTDTTTYGNTSEYCLTQFDTILCWPRTPRATLAALPCLDEFQGIQYDSSRKYIYLQCIYKSVQRIHVNTYV